MPDPKTPVDAAATSQSAPEGAPPEPSPSPGNAPGADSGAPAPPAKPTAKDRVAMARERLRLKQEMQKARAAQTEGRAAAEKLAKDLEDARKAANERDAELAAALEDPIAWAAKKGKKADDAIRRFLASDDPNAKQIEAVEQLRRELDAERKARETERQERERREQEAAKARQEEAEGAAIAGFVAQITGEQKKKYPYISLVWTPQEVARETRALHEWAKKEGHRYSFDEVAAFFDKRCKTRYESQEALRRELLPESATEPAKGKNGQATGAAASARSGQASAPVARERPRVVQAKTREQEAEEDLRMLREASAKDRAAVEASQRKN